MAETLAPVLGASISGQSPVQQNHWAGSVADLVGGFAASLRSNQGSGPNQNQLEEQAWSFFTGEMNKAASIAQVEGDWDRARRIRDGALAKVTPYIDTSSGRAKAAIQAVTGEDPDRFLSNPDLEVKNQLVSDELYAGFYANTDPALAPHERESLAAADVARIRANEAAIAAARSHWNVEGSRAMMDNIKFGRERALRLYANNTNPGSNSVEDIRQAKMGWEQIKAGMARPHNVSNDDWAPIQAEIERTDTMLSQAEELLGLPAMKNANAARSAELVKGIGSLVDSNATNVSQMAIAATIYSGDFNAISGVMSTITGEAEFLQNLNSKDLIQVGLKNDPDGVMDKIEAGMAGASAQTKYQIANDMAKLVNSNDISSQIKSSPGALDNWAQGTLHGIAALKSLGSEDTGSWITSNDYDTVFGPAFFNNLQAATEADPVLGAELKVQALVALNSQSTQLEGLLTGMEQSGPFIWDRTEGTFRLNPNPAGRLNQKGPGTLGSRLFSDNLPGIHNLLFGGEGVLDKAVNELYGGDVNALIKDKGARIRRAGFGADQQTLLGQARAFVSGDATNYRVLSQELDNYFRQPAPANASKYAEAFRKNTSVRDRLYAADADVFSSLLPETETRPTQGGTTGTQNIMNASGSMTQRMMDKYEGGGDYDTLFGHSQNGGPFNGVKISSMTLSQVLDFANPRGQYGQWVKGQVGRVATPMGRFQFVGTTLRSVANEMGLDLDNTVFTPEVQNEMFNHYANKVISGKTGAAARTAMRNAWEGFKNASDADLDVMIEEIRTGKANFGPASTSGSRFGGGVGLAGQRIEDLLPNAQGLALADEARGTPGASGLSVEDTDVGSAPEAREVQMDEVSVRGGGSDSASTAASRTDNAALAADTQRVLRRLGLDDSTPVFRSMAEFEENIDDLPEGSVVVVNGRKITV